MAEKEGLTRKRETKHRDKAIQVSVFPEREEGRL